MLLTVEPLPEKLARSLAIGSPSTVGNKTKLAAVEAAAGYPPPPVDGAAA